MFSEITKIIRSGLNRKLASTVLFSIVLVEFILLFPTAMSFKDHELKMLERHAESLISSIDSALIEGVPIHQSDQLSLHLKHHKAVVGYAICSAEQCSTLHGEDVSQASRQIGKPTSQLVADDSRLEVTRPLHRTEHAEAHWIVLRIDSSELRPSITAFLWKNIAVIAIISIFVTLVTLIGVVYIVINPVLRLKQTMCMAMENPTRPANYLFETSDNDEIADLAQTYNRLLFDINHYQNQLTESKREIERGLSSSEARWKFALEGSGDGVWDWAPLTDEVFFSHQIMDLLGYSPNHFIDTMAFWTELIHPDDRDASMKAMQAHLSGETDDYSFEHRIRHQEGHWIWILSRGMVINRDEDNKATRVVGTHTDIRSHKDTQALIWRQANLDLLTELPNRRLFQEYVRQGMLTATEHQQTMVLMFLDLDNFKIINDTHGHRTGDRLLQETANRLKQCVQPSNIVSRLGGDEFTIILENITDESVVNDVADNVLQALAKPFQIDLENFHITASIGITRFPQDASHQETLLMNADQAMYAAKEQGHNRYCYFSQAMRTRAQTRMRTINELRQAVTEEQFEVFYQPIMCMKTGRIVKAESLIRWQHPKQGLLGADSVIRLAEETGMIVDIGHWVFRKSIEQLARWQSQFDAALQMSVNTSPSQYRSDDSMVGLWLNHLKTLDVAPESLVIEITENMMMDFDEKVIGKLEALRSNGIKLALDDFGTGYSSLSYLQQINSHFLKIDRSFVSNITENEQNMALCREIINIAHIFGMQVIAEGIETTAQAKLLAASGCDFGQGYLYSKPINAQAFETLLKHQYRGAFSQASQPSLN